MSARKLGSIAMVLPIVALTLMCVVWVAVFQGRHAMGKHLASALVLGSTLLVPVGGVAGITVAILAMVRARREREEGATMPVALITFGFVASIGCAALACGVFLLGLSGL